MKLQSYKRLLKTDFKADDQALVDQLGNSLNSGIEFLYQALNKRLTIGDNLQASERDITLTVDDAGNPTNDSFVNVDFGSTVRTVFVGKAQNLTNSNVYPTSAPFVIWNNTTKGIQIVNVRGLVPGNVFTLRLVIFG